MINPYLLSGADLAFIGDAYYEMIIREYVINKGITHLSKLHDESVKYVSRTAQHIIIDSLKDDLTDLEKEIFKRGRNYNYKKSDVDYINASGFEAIIGYLYLKKDLERLKVLIDKAISIIENKYE